LIIDVSAKVTITQTYTNLSEAATDRAKYVFPVPARAAVCVFELRLADGEVITAVAKDNDQAVQEFERATREGKIAGLVEWVTDDVFTISIGSIPAKESLTTKLVYAMDLMDDEAVNQVRFQLPMCVGQRYGTPPPALTNATSTAAATPICIYTTVQCSGRIRNITSPTHPDALIVIPSPNEPTCASAQFRSPVFLDHDFVLIVHADDLDVPRCFAEVMHGTEGEMSIAMQLTVIPTLGLPPVFAQEYLFMIDRSGSMDGERIETAKRTLVMLLRQLPKDETVFNIFSFGTSFTKLWNKSSAYTQSTLDDATMHVDSMSANYGGTEIRASLQEAFNSRHAGLPTIIFLLTDGQSYDVDYTRATVAVAAAASAAHAPLRVFVLGIGDVTTAMCEGIARAGNGKFMLAGTTVQETCWCLIQISGIVEII